MYGVVVIIVMGMRVIIMVPIVMGMRVIIMVLIVMGMRGIIMVRILMGMFVIAVSAMHFPDGLHARKEKPVQDRSGFGQHPDNFDGMFVVCFTAGTQAMSTIKGAAYI